jgi:calpain-7
MHASALAEAFAVPLSVVEALLAAEGGDIQRVTDILLSESMRGSNLGSSTSTAPIRRPIPPKTAPPPRTAVKQSQQGQLQSNGSTSTPLQPAAEDQLLMDASLVFGNIYGPFDAEHVAKMFAASGTHGSTTTTSSYTDPDGPLPLAEQQLQRQAVWESVRASSEGEMPCIVRGDTISPLAITQSVVGDCSFLSSLSVCAEWERRFHKPLITALLYPQHPSTHRPVLSSTGHYVVRFFFNGCWRCVSIDDRLPMCPRGFSLGGGSPTAQRRLLCSASNVRGELWVSLLEKAFMKVRGGYALGAAGSISATDIRFLCGWIPEQLETSTLRGSHSKDQADLLWLRLLTGFAAGDCLITLSSGPQAARGLIPCHSYAVLDVREVGPAGVRMVYVKNPWGLQRYTGRYHPTDTKRWTSQLCAALHYDAASHAMVDNGLFWMEFSDVLAEFMHVTLAWNPASFSQSAHLVTLSCPHNERHYRQNDMAQLKLAATMGGEVWVLLSRHLPMRRQDIWENNPFLAGTQAFLGARIYHGTQQPLEHCGSTALCSSPLSNSYNVLLKFPSGSHPNLWIVPIQASQNDNVAGDMHEAWSHLSLSIYAFIPLQLRKVPAAATQLHVQDALPHQHQLSGSWTTTSAGGCSNFPSFSANPMWRLTVRGGGGSTTLRLDLTPASKMTQVGMQLLQCQGGRYRAGGGRRGLPSDIVVASSGTFRPGFCSLLQENCPPGQYTLVPSTFQPQTLDTFILQIASSQPVTLTQL